MGNLSSQLRARTRIVFSSITQHTGGRWWYKVGLGLLSICLIAAAKFDSLSEARAAIRHYATHARTAFVTSDPDTVVFFGPKQFLTVTNATQVNFVESFSVPVPPSPTSGVWAPAANQYTLRLQRAGGSLTVATVAVNGTQVATAADFASASYIERPITVPPPVPSTATVAVITLTVTLKGAAAAGLIATVVGTPNATFTIFGPKVYTKTSTTPTHFVESGLLPTGGSAPYVISAVASVAGTKATITLNGVQVIKDIDFGTNVIKVTKTVSVLSGNNVMLVDVRGTTGKTITITGTATDKTPPTLTIAAPALNLVTNANTVTVSGTSQDRDQTQVKVNAVVATMSGPLFTQYSATVPLIEGANSLAIRATDKAGNHTDSTRTVTRDTQAPTLTVTSPADASFTNQDAVTVAGTVTDGTTATVKVNGVLFPVTQGAFSGSFVLAAGANFITIAATDAGGNVTSVVRKVTQAKQPPVLTVTTPAAAFVRNTSPVPISGTVTGTAPIAVTVNGVAMTVANGAFSGSVPIVEGANDLAFTARDAATNQTVVHRLGALDTHAPVVAITAPAEGLLTKQTSVNVAGTVTDASATTVTVNGISAPVANGAFSATVALATEGTNAISVVATDAATNHSTVSRSVVRDTQAPVLAITSPADNLVTKTTTVQITGNAVDASPVAVSVNSVPLVVDATGALSGSITLVEGENVLNIVATDGAGNTVSQVLRVTLDTQGPVVTVTEPADGLSVTSETILVSGTVADATGVTVTVNGNPVSVAGGAFSTSAPLSVGTNTISIVTTDGAGNTSSATRIVTRTVETPPAGSAMTELLPRDPAVQAPAASASVATTPFAAGAFLYSGPNPLQTGVAPGTIEPRRGAIVRGRVLGKDGLPLAGVEVTVLDHPEFGRTMTRASGQYDLAVNGGALLMLHYAKSGLLEVIRGAEVEWQDYTVLDDVILIGLDPQVTLVDLSGGTGTMQVARASAQTDADGTRQATVLFPAGTTASMVLGDGTMQPLSTLHVRATEYTVGENGPKMMPAPLPPTSRYTYAVELTVDEARAAGATSVHFSQTVPFYIENFLGFPVGLPVPVGVLDPKRAVWVPDDNGVIIKIVGKTDGLADIDANGDSVADNPTELATLGITADERSRLATLYETGRSLWRIPLTHFSAIDGNFPFTSDTAQHVPPKVNPTKSDKQSKSKCVTEARSTIECQTQVLGEQVGLVGAPFALHYRSDRVPGRKLANTIETPLIDGVVPPGLHRVGLKVEVAGREFSAQFVPAPNLQDTFVWDGIDSYGRLLQGGQPVKVTISYAYDAFYAVPADVARSFGLTCRGEGRDRGTVDCIIPESVSTVARQEIIMEQVRHMRIGPFSAGAAALGGWSLDAHDAYDVAARELYTGDGRRRSAQAVGAVVTTLPAHVFSSEGVAVGPSGTLFIADAVNSFSGTLMSFGSDGVIDTITTAIRAPGKMAVDRAGRVYVISSDQALYRVTPVSRTIELIAGTPDTTTVFITQNNTWKSGRDQSMMTLASSTIAHGPSDGSNRFFGPDATGIDQYLSGPSIAFTVMPPAIPATELRSTQFNGVAIGPDGTIYLSERTGFVWRIGPDGMATVYAGTGLHGATPDPDGGLAIKSSFTDLQGIAVGPDGILYLADGQRIRRVGTDGVITSVAGNLDSRTGNDGDIATDQLLLEPTDLSVGSDGVYILDSGVDSTGAGHIYLLQTDGRMIRVAGRDPFSTGGDGELATRGLENTPSAIAVGPDGTVYCAIRFQIRAVHPTLEGVGHDEIAVAAEDGSTLDVFNGDGLHLRTMDALTGVALLRFGYDTVTRFTTVHTAFAGDTSIVSGHEFFLKSATDAFGNATTIVRDDSLKPLAIVGPFGQRSELALDADGFLSRVTNPAGEAVGLTYHAGGLLATVTDPLGRVSQFTYDTTGLLVSDQDPTGGALNVVRTEVDGAWTVTENSTLGRTSKYRVETTTAGGEVRLNTNPAGLITRTADGKDGESSTISPDGTITVIRRAPDSRFGMQAPVLSERTTITPGGLVATISESRSTSISNTDDPTSPPSVSESTTLNDREFDRQYDASTRTFTMSTPAGRFTTARLDSLGRVIEEATPDITAWQYQYDLRGRPTSVIRGNRQSRFAYDPNGRLASTIDPSGRTSQYFYDVADRLTRQLLPDGREFDYTYDSVGKIRSFTPPGKPAHQFEYNALGLLATYDPPSLGAGTWRTTFQYDLDRELTQVTRPDGQIIRFEYDAAGRPTNVLVPTGAVHYTYSPQTGRATSVTSPYGGALSFTYDGHLLTGVSWSGEVAGTVSATYNSDFALSGIGVNGQAPVNYTYDQDGLLQQAGALTMTRSATNSQLTGTALGSVATIQSFSQFGELARESATLTDTTAFDVVYTRDILGRVSALAETVGGTTTTRAFSYDSVGRLSEVRENGALAAAYTYDGNGNRLRVTRPAGVEIGSYDAQDRLLSYGNATYGYTASGDLRYKAVGPDTTRYTYDVLENLLQVRLPNGSVIDYVVDGTNRRMGKKINGVLVRQYLYQDQLNPVAELDGAGAIVSRFVYGSRPNVPDYMVRAGTTFRIISDELGSVRMVVNVVDNTVAQRLSYDEFGRVTFNSNPGFQPFGFAGGLLDAETNLIRVGARDYDSETGRWTTKDPLGFAAGDANLYDYVGGDPVNRIDPSGLGGWETAANYAAGFGDYITLGGTNWIRDQIDANGVIDRCSTAYSLGEWTAIGGEIAAGAAAGAEAAGAAGKGLEFSHWIPKRMGAPRSILNGNFVTTAEHALTDPFRYRFMRRVWKELNPIREPLSRQWGRIPKVLKGAGAGGGVAAATSALDCGCDK